MTVRKSVTLAFVWPVGVALVAVACAMMIGAAYLAVETSQFLSDARSSPGRVIRLEHSSSGRSSIYYPIVQYRTAEGQTITFRSSVANVAALGQAVQVLALPTNPGDARIDSYMSLWFWPTLLAGLAAVFLLVGVRFIAGVAKEGQSSLTTG